MTGEDAWLEAAYEDANGGTIDPDMIDDYEDEDEDDA